jgi:two-component system sensor histidine kinase KdpD
MTGALAVIAALTFVFSRLIPVNITTVALSFCLAILAIASFWGLTEAIAASIVAVLCFDYFFLPPIGAFTISDPQNWVALFAFLTTAVVASHLSSSAREQEQEAGQRQQEMEKLYALSRAFLLQDGEVGKVCYQVAQVFDLPAAAIYDRASDKVFRAGAEELAVEDGRLRDATLQGTAWQDPVKHVQVIPVSLGSAPLASLAVPCGLVSDVALHAIANLTAIILERTRAQETSLRAEATRRNEQLKSTLLDALAHELKTPLTSIKAAVSSVREGDEPPSRELMKIVEEETDRLNSLVTEALQMARIDAGHIYLELQRSAPADLIAEALDKMGASRADREINVEAPATLPLVLADHELIALALRQLIGNSLKFAQADSPVTVRAKLVGSGVVFSVIDRGPGIPEREQFNIFDKFYRLPEHAERIPGSGMGLTIAKEIVEAHRGRIGVNSHPGEGSEFFFTVPVTETK